MANVREFLAVIRSLVLLAASANSEYALLMLNFSNPKIKVFVLSKLCILVHVECHFGLKELRETSI